MALKLKLWGVRGSIACATPQHMKYGGNTSCIEVRTGDHCFVLDVGTGIRSFGDELAKNGKCVSQDRKSTRLNSSHVVISYAVFCLKKKNKQCILPKTSQI